MEKLFKQIYSIHKRQLKNVNDKGEKLFVTFAGVPGSGKTTIAKELETRLKAIRINSIDVEKIYVALGNERDILTKRAYVDWLMDKIAKEFKNKTIILDKGIERTYEEIFKWVKENDYKVFVIGVECKRKTAERRLIMREGEENAKDYLAEMDRWVNEYKEYKRLELSDLTLNTEEGNLTTWTNVILERLRKILN